MTPGRISTAEPREQLRPEEARGWRETPRWASAPYAPVFSPPSAPYAPVARPRSAPDSTTVVGVLWTAVTAGMLPSRPAW